MFFFSNCSATSNATGIILPTLRRQISFPNRTEIDLPILKSGMTLALEPMVSIGRHEIILDKNKQTFKMKDDSACAHFEHTVLVTEKGSEVLTKM